MSPFVFFDVRSSDAPTARTFYEGLFGWTGSDLDASPATVPMLTEGGALWGGFTPLPAGDERCPQWIPHVPVIDDPTGATLALRETKTP